MIDKSIRQHYQDGENVDQLKKWTNKILSSGKEKLLPTEGETKKEYGVRKATDFVTSKLTSAATKKLAGTGG